VSLSELRKRVDIEQPTASRLVDALGDGRVGASGEPAGLGLVTTRRDPEDRRNVLVKLTAEGKTVLTEILKRI
jgi:DNA-binding MarR family transcriptional regulator